MTTTAYQEWMKRNAEPWHWSSTTAAAPWDLTPKLEPEVKKFRQTESEEPGDFTAAQVTDDTVRLKKVAAWVGARAYNQAGLRVPTLEGVEVAFVGDWIVRDQDGIVYIYTDEDFKRDFREFTIRDF